MRLVAIAAALIGLGKMEAGRRHLSSALRRLEQAIEIDPHDAEAQFAYAEVLEAMGRTNEALAAYFRTLEYNPLHAKASQNIGAIQLANDQPEQALARFDQAVELLPEDGLLRFQRGQAHLALKHLPQAIADFQTASRTVGDRPEIFYQLALALDAAQQKKEALQAAEQALRLAPNYADARDLSQRLRR